MFLFTFSLYLVLTPPNLGCDTVHMSKFNQNPPCEAAAQVCHMLQTTKW